MSSTLFAPEAEASSLTTVSLESLKLRNFKGIRELTILAGGNDLSVWGDNGTGKTSIADSLFWLLFGKDSSNRKDFEIKTLGVDGKPFHNLEHEVEAKFTVNGKGITLRKVYKENWVTTRGKATQELKSHTTDHFINDVPTTMGDYVDRVRAICPEEKFRLLTDPTYFNSTMPWQKRRELLLEVCGDISDADVIAANEKLSELPAYLEDRSLDEHKKYVKAQKEKVEKERSEIPIRIAELDRSLPNIEGADKSILESELSDHRIKRTELQAELTRIQSGGEAAERKKTLAVIDAELMQLRTAATRAVADRQIADDRKLSELKSKADEPRRAIARIKGEIEDADARRKRLESEMAAKQAEINKVRESEFQPVASAETCPACGLDLPREALEAARQKALEDFNLSKSQRLEKLVAEGKQIRETDNGLKDKIVLQSEELEELEKSLADLDGQVAAEQSRLDLLKESAAPAPTNPKIAELETKRAEIVQSIERLGNDQASEVQGVNERLAKVDHDIRQVETKVAAFGQVESTTKRIEELKAEEKLLAGKIEDFEKQLFLIEDFIRCKVAMLTEKINAKFDLVSFKLFDEQVNGGIAECCVATVKGVPFEGALNHGARVNAGLECINVFARHFAFAPLVLIDNSESITCLMRTIGQQIRLVVREEDKALRVATHER